MIKFSTDFAKQKLLLELQKGEISAKNGYIDIDTVEKTLGVSISKPKFPSEKSLRKDKK